MLNIISHQRKANQNHFTPTKMPITTSAGKDVEKLEPAYTVVEMYTATLENTLVVPQNVKHKKYDPANSTPRYIPKRNENRYPHKNLYTNIHSSTTCIAKRWKQSKHSSTDEWIN